MRLKQPPVEKKGAQSRCQSGAIIRQSVVLTHNTNTSGDPEPSADTEPDLPGSPDAPDLWSQELTPEPTPEPLYLIINIDFNWDGKTVKSLVKPVNIGEKGWSPLYNESDTEIGVQLRMYKARKYMDMPKVGLWRLEWGPQKKPHKMRIDMARELKEFWEICRTYHRTNLLDLQYRY